MNYTKGSEWRKWDLHVHTASSYDHRYKAEDSDELLVKAWENQGFAAVAITDHFIIDANRIRKLRSLTSKVQIFPGVEMRTDKGGINIHVIGIFSETIDLDILQQDFEVILLRQYQKADETDETRVRDLNDIVSFVKKHKGILTIHAGKKNNGVDTEITNSLEISQAIKRDLVEQIDIFEIGKVEDVSSYRKHVFKNIEEKPLIICSDNHDPRKYTLKENLWIKANPTFEGLVQTLMQPSERVFIGSIPEDLDKQKRNKANHIKGLRIYRIESPKNVDENWFDTELEFNPSLVAIIGNKGSGKSALSDILGHLCKAKNVKSASFLSAERFRKMPENKSRDYVAEIEWVDGKKEERSLDEDRQEVTIEEAQYLPQKYIESVCNDLSSEFQQEIDMVIFSYIDITERNDAKNLNDLIAIKSKSIQEKIMAIKNNLNKCNLEIIKLESKKTDSYKNLIKANLEKCRENLERHEKNKPNEVKKDTKKLSVEYERKLSIVNEKIRKLEIEESKIVINLKNINGHIDKNKEITDEFDLLYEKVENFKNQLVEYKLDYKISLERFAFSIVSPREDLEKERDELLIKQKEFQEFLDVSETASEKSISKQLLASRKELKDIIDGADNEEKIYQKYVHDLQEWEKNRENIIGNELREGSIEFYKKELGYIETQLDKDYQKKIEERLELVREIYEQKKLIEKIYKDIYKPVETKLRPLLQDNDDKIEFDVQIALKDKDIGVELLSFINQQLSGIFKGKADANVTMNKFIQSTNFYDFLSLINFTNNVLRCITDDFNKSEQKVKDKLTFYNKLFSIDYIQAEYNLTLGSRRLSMLSPGERGIVLLVFYLALSKNELPLIIDQPEDNLDNQSVYKRLVPCIKEAKKRRQIIIVTHNPNIAIACDAEQIICSSIDKKDNHIEYKTGGIEDCSIRETVVNILEGTMPAFELRKLKYTYELYSK